MLCNGRNGGCLTASINSTSLLLFLPTPHSNPSSTSPCRLIKGQTRNHLEADDLCFVNCSQGNSFIPNPSKPCCVTLKKWPLCFSHPHCLFTALPPPPPSHSQCDLASVNNAAALKSFVVFGDSRIGCLLLLCCFPSVCFCEFVCVQMMVHKHLTTLNIAVV